MHQQRVCRAILALAQFLYEGARAENEGNPPRRKDRTYREIYITRVSDKKNWVSKAEDLLHAASFLESQVEKIYRSWKMQANLLPSDRPTETIREGIVEVYWMLVGCAFENLLKGALVRRLARGKKGNRISEPKLPKELNTHDVRSLVEELKLKFLTRQEVDLLKRVEEIIAWRGRYPVPTTYTAIRAFRLGTRDLATAKRLVDRFRRL
jgi:hypothetical protein